MVRSSVRQQPDPRASRPSTSWLARFPEGLTYLWLALGFVLCRYLTDTLLPHLGLTQLAHDYESAINTVAPYIELPLCAVLAVQILRRSVLPGLLAVAGTLALDYYFFVRFDERVSWLALGLLGLAALGSYAVYVYRARRERPAATPLDRLGPRLRLVCGLAYGIGIGVAVLLKHGLEQAALGGRWGEDLPNAMPLVATLMAVTVYLVVRYPRPARDVPVP